MKGRAGRILMGVGFVIWAASGIMAQEPQPPAQKRILMERGEKITGQRLKLVKRVIESYQGCQVLSRGNELTGLVINGKTYEDFTLIVRDAKKMVIVVTADGVVSFDF